MSSIPSRRKRESPSHPYLSGNFAPVTRTQTPTPCSYTGAIPRELLGGQYVRNGANPIANEDLGREAHWFDGDGMLAGVIFERSPSTPGGVTPNFVNQFILTDLCISTFQERALRTPIITSVTTLVNPFASLIWITFRVFRSILLVLLSHLPGSRQAIKRISVANTAIYFHDGRALATCESGPPVRIQLPGLETVGWFNGNEVEEEGLEKRGGKEKDVGFGGTGLLSWMREWTTGHPKVDPRTGELILFHCSFVAPYIHCSVVPSVRPHFAKASRQKLLNVPVPGCSGGKMMHDFGVSLNHTIILDLPLSLTPTNLLVNKPVLAYEADKPSRFGVFPRYRPDQIRWFETEACCIFHTANTWDEAGPHGETVAVNMLACRLTSAAVVFSTGNLPPPPHPKKDHAKKQRMSFFAKYDEEEERADLENISSDEKSPLLPAKDASVVESSKSTPLISHDDDEQCRLYFYRFSLEDSEPTITDQYALSSIPCEFPTLNPGAEMACARYIYACSTSNESFGAALGQATRIDVLVKMDVQTLLARGARSPPRSITGCIDTRSILEILSSEDEEDPIRAFKMPPNRYAQEARFVSRADPVSEDDGYLLFYVFDESQLDANGDCLPDAASELWILDAKNMKDVIATVRLPQRVPYGLHGNWFTEDQIANQRAVERFRSLDVDASDTWFAQAKSQLIRALG